jgi:hypothetical protein
MNNLKHEARRNVEHWNRQSRSQLVQRVWVYILDLCCCKYYCQQQNCTPPSLRRWLRVWKRGVVLFHVQRVYCTVVDREIEGVEILRSHEKDRGEHGDKCTIRSKERDTLRTFHFAMILGPTKVSDWKLTNMCLYSSGSKSVLRVCCATLICYFSACRSERWKCRTCKVTTKVRWFVPSLHPRSFPWLSFLALPSSYQTCGNSNKWSPGTFGRSKLRSESSASFIRYVVF